jgi:cobalamin-dependent methionine synthase I
MFVIGELINGMYVYIGKGIKEKDKAVIQKCALDQIKAGADALDINCGPASRQPLDDIQWLVQTIQEVTDKPIALDSSKPAVIES